MTGSSLVAIVGDRRLRVCGFHDDGTPILADGAVVISLEAAAREVDVAPEDVVIEEVPGAW